MDKQQKKLISRDENGISSTQHSLRSATAELNNILNEFYALGLSLKTEEEAFAFFNDPAAMLVKKMDLKDNSLAQRIADDKILQLLEDPRPLQILQSVQRIKPPKGYHAFNRTIKAKAVKFEKGAFFPKEEALKAIEDSFSVYAETGPELEVYELTQQIQGLILKLYHRLKNDTEDPANALVNLRAPLSYYMDGGFIFQPNMWRQVAERLKSESK